MQEYTRVGEKVIATGAVRYEGTSVQYMPIEFPAVASHDMTMALKDSAIKNNIAYHLGIVQSKDSFYGQHNPEKMPIAEELKQKWDAWVKGGVLCSEMEAATLFTISQIKRIEAGAILAIETSDKDTIKKMTEIVLESITYMEREKNVS